MKRTTIALTDDLASALAREARRSNRSASEVARAALSRYLGLSENGEPRKLPFVGIGRSDGRIGGADLEDVLAREWVDPRRS